MALSTNTQSVAAGIVNIASGKVDTDAGAAAVTVFTIGFIPRIVRWHNLTDRTSYEWFEGMTNPGALKTVAAGTRTLETTEGITVGTAAAGTAGTFSIPTTIILASKSFAWEAIG